VPSEHVRILCVTYYIVYLYIFFYNFYLLCTGILLKFDAILQNCEEALKQAASVTDSKYIYIYIHSYTVSQEVSPTFLTVT